MNKQKFLIVVAGPTAVGKTALSTILAKRLGTEIISADSRQFYKGLTIGTAKPTTEELKAVRHHFIDLMPIDEEFSAGKFEMATLELLETLYRKMDAVLMTGGSGLYIQAVCKGMNEIPDVDLIFRDELYKELDLHGIEPLVEELRMKDPDYWKAVDRSNPQRVIRALEVCRGTGKPYSTFRTDTYIERDFKVIKIGLEREREELFDRINVRVDQMIEQGLIEEAKKYYEKRHLNALKTVGYKEVFGYLDQEYDLAEAIRLLKRNTRRYAKRQLTWFKKDTDFQWFHPDDLPGIYEHIDDKMCKN